jgi:hypothetical protein
VNLLLVTVEELSETFESQGPVLEMLNAHQGSMQFSKFGAFKELLDLRKRDIARIRQKMKAAREPGALDGSRGGRRGGARSRR